jgi:hypothetical protein
MMRRAMPMLAAAGLAACGIVSPIGAPPATCQFPDGVPLSFAEETTLGEVGLASPGGEDLSTHVWITAKPIPFQSSGETTRVICAVTDDGTYLAPYPVERMPNEAG